MFGRRRKIKVYLTPAEMRLLLHALVNSRNKLITQGRYTDAIDDLLSRLY